MISRYLVLTRNHHLFSEFFSLYYFLSCTEGYYTIGFVEDTLIKSKCFSLPGRKQLLKSDMEYEFVVMDATETPIQRPKKSKNNSTQGRKNDIP